MLVETARCDYRDWLHSARDLSPHTIKAYEADLSHFEAYLGEGRELEHITRESVLGFVSQQRLAGLTTSSIRRRASSIRGFCLWLFEGSRIETNPCDRIAIDLPARRSLPKALPENDLARLLRYLQAEAEGASKSAGPDGCRRELVTLLAVALMVVTGLRVGELVSVELNDIDLDSGTIRVLGKGRRERVVYVSNGWVVDILTRYLKSRRCLDIAHANVFIRSTGKPLSTATLRTRLATASRSAGVDRRVTPHMLRHTAATQLVESGVDIRFVQRLLGHASLSTTEIYTHVSDQSLRRVIAAADVIGRVLNSE
jgi:site-specific recombinase XerD